MPSAAHAEESSNNHLAFAAKTGQAKTLRMILTLMDRRRLSDPGENVGDVLLFMWANLLELQSNLRAFMAERLELTASIYYRL